MSGIYIKGMKMPKNMRFKAVVVLSEETAYVHTDEMEVGVCETYKAFPVHDHGDLFDMDALKKELFFDTADCDLEMIEFERVSGAPVVIPADRSEDETD